MGADRIPAHEQQHGSFTPGRTTATAAEQPSRGSPCTAAASAGLWPTGCSCSPPRGRRSGRQYTTPIGYVSADPSRSPHQPGTVAYLFRAAPGGADWLANLRAQPAVTVRIGRHHYQARASVLRGERQRRQALTCYLHGRTLPARAARRAFGLDRARPDESVTQAARASQPVIVALRLDDPASVHGG